MSPARQARPMAAQGGFSLIELMVGLAIGLICVIVIATVLSVAEGQRRGTTQGSDAQVNGDLALYTLQRELAMAGYGFAEEPNAIGCSLQAYFNNVAIAGNATSSANQLLPSLLVPVQITQGTGGASDTVSVLASSKAVIPGATAPVGYTVPSRVVPPLYNPGDQAYNVTSNLSVTNGDLMVSVIQNPDTANLPCEMFQVTSQPATSGSIPRADAASGWNPTGFPKQPTLAANASVSPVFQGSVLVNMGTVVYESFSINGTQQLVDTQLSTANLAAGKAQPSPSVLQSNIVLMKAMYGYSSAGNGVVDTYNYTAPTTNAGWLQVLAVRLVIVARSAKFEKTAVTVADPLWDVGTATTVAGAATCGSSKCVTLKIDGLSNWQNYRYKVFDTIVPLRNQRWKY